MGFLKDINTLRKQAKEIDKTFDPAAQMRDAKAAMEQASEVMTLQAEAARLAAGGEPARAQVNTTRDTGQLLDLQPVLELSLLVFAGDRPPYPMTVRQVVRWLNWVGSPRVPIWR